MNSGGDNSKRALRHEKKWQRLGTHNAACYECGIADVCCLRKEQPSGRIVCESCRQKHTEYSFAEIERRRDEFAKEDYLDPACLACPETDLRALEFHHVAGKANSDLGGPLCGNCHAIQTDAQEDLPANIRRRDPQRRPLQLQAALQFGLAIMFTALAACARNATTTAFFGMIAVALAGCSSRTGWRRSSSTRIRPSRMA